MNIKISETMMIPDILKQYPAAYEAFLIAGINSEDPEDLIERTGSKTMLKTLAKVYDISADLLIYKMEEKILEAEAEREYLLSDIEKGQKLDFYGNTICPIKFTFKDRLEEIIKERYVMQGSMLDCCLESGKDDADSCDTVWFGPDLDALPNLTMSKEFDNYMSSPFLANVCGKGSFETDFFPNINPKVKEAGLIDEQGDYCVYAAMADIFLVDKEQLGDLPIPRTTEDLLSPIYQDKIVIFGKDADTVSTATLLYIQKEFGTEGLKKLAHNVKCALHGSVMSKTAGSKREDAGAIYLVSGFFANTCIKGNLEIIWPEDGCMTLPMFMLVKKSGLDRVGDIANYIASDEFAETCNNAFTVSTNGNVKSYMPDDAKLRWLGWDYIRENDLLALSTRAEVLFQREWYACHPGKELVR